MSAQKWLYQFLIFSLSLLVLVALMNLYVDPYKVFGQSWRMNYTSDRNGRYSKLERLKSNQEVQCLLLGSSRSEFFFPKDIEKITGMRTFTSSMGDAFTYTKYAFGKKGIELLPELKQIWYVSDFYEFNEKQISWLLAELDEFKDYFSEEKFDRVMPNQFRKVKSLFSLSSFSASMKTLKDKWKNKPKSYLDDGSTTVSLTQKDFKELHKEILKTQNHYLKDKWFEYRELSVLSKEMIQELAEGSQSSQIEMKVILTPIHPELLKKLKSMNHLLQLWEKWREFWRKLADEGKITLYDFTESQKYFSADESHWQDGVHFSRKASLNLIERIKGE